MGLAFGISLALFTVPDLVSDLVEGTRAIYPFRDYIFVLWVASQKLLIGRGNGIAVLPAVAASAASAATATTLTRRIRFPFFAVQYLVPDVVEAALAVQVGIDHGVALWIASQ